jgi:hypothetical protein
MTPVLVLLVPLLTGQAGGPPDADGGAKPTPASASTNAPVSPDNDQHEGPPVSGMDNPLPGPPTPREKALSAPPRALQDLVAAQARMADLERQVSELQAARQADQERITALETELADERSRREEAVRSQERREQALSTATDGLEQVDKALASGSGDVSAAVERAQALTGEAGAGGSGQEAVLAGEAQRWLALSQEALQRGDLFQARVAADVASLAAAQARALAGSAATGRGGGTP